MQRLKSLFLEHIMIDEFSTFTFEPPVYLYLFQTFCNTTWYFAHFIIIA